MSPFDQYEPFSTVAVTVQRADSTINLSLRLGRLSDRKKELLWWYIPILFGVWCFGIIVFLKKPEHASVRLFFIFIQLFLFRLTMFDLIATPLQIMNAINWITASMFLPAVFWHLVVLFPDKQFTLGVWKKSVVGMYIFCGCLSALSLTILGMIVSQREGVIPTFVSPVLWFIQIANNLCIAFSILLGFYKLIIAKDFISHNQLRWLMIGFIAGLLPLALFLGYNDWLFNLFPSTMYIEKKIRITGLLLSLTEVTQNKKMLRLGTKN